MISLAIPKVSNRSTFRGFKQQINANGFIFLRCIDINHCTLKIIKILTNILKLRLYPPSPQIYFFTGFSNLILKKFDKRISG